MNRLDRLENRFYDCIKRFGGQNAVCIQCSNLAHQLVNDDLHIACVLYVKILSIALAAYDTADTYPLVPGNR